MVRGKFQVGPPVRPTELTAEEVSQLMDGELDAGRSAHACEALHESASIETWMCYHMIGETLRVDGGRLIPGFTARFGPRLATEPALLAPSRMRPTPATVAWALAAGVAAVGVVGWVALTTMAVPQAVVATAPQAPTQAATQAATVRPAGVRGPVVNEYLLAHQEYSPTTAIQGVRPYLRAVATDTPDAPE